MKRFLILTGIVLALASCNIHEWPEGERLNPYIQVDLNLKFQEDIPIYKDVAAEDVRANADVRRRVTINVYKLLPDGSIPEDATPQHSYEFYGDRTYFSFRVPSASYRIMAWADYSAGMAGWWDASKFQGIKLKYRTHEGNNEGLRAFRGIVDANLEGLKNGNDRVTLDMDMIMPMAKFRIISTDKAELKARMETDNLDFSQFVVKLRYAQFMPNSFGMFHDKPVDSEAGVSFVTKVIESADGNVDLGFDYVLINGKETAVPVAVELYNKAGKLLNTTTVNIPLLRSHLTIVRGAFFTTQSASGITINPGFDGSFTVEI